MKTLMAAAFAAAAFSLSTTVSFAAIPLRDKGTYASPEQVRALAHQYYMIPASVRQYYEDHGNIVYFYNKELLPETLIGLYTGANGQNGFTLVTNRDFGGAEAITHELGHMVDDVCQENIGTEYQTISFHGTEVTVGQGGIQYVSDLEPFQRIWMKENGNACVSSYERVSAGEYFAGAFGAYCTRPEKLKATAPETYAYIDSLVTLFSGIYPADAERLSETNPNKMTIDAYTGGQTSLGIYPVNAHR